MSQKLPKYDLEEIQGLVRNGNLDINYSGQAETDSVNLGYFDEDVKKCLMSLTSKHYKNTVKYSIGKIEVDCDEYCINYLGPVDCVDPLYIKFRYNSTWLTLHSFHRDR